MSSSIKVAVLVVLLLTFCSVKAKISHITVPKDFQCSSRQYFDSTGLVCVQCGSSSKPIDGDVNNGRGIGCECDDSSLFEEDTCSIEELESGSCLDIMCTPTCSDLSLPTSKDNSKCITCSVEKNTTQDGEDGDSQIVAEYDATAGDCTCNNPLPASNPDSKLVLNHKLVEIYDLKTGEPVRKECMQCPKSTAVITKDVLRPGEIYHKTVGVQYIPNSYECVSCPDPHNMYFDTAYQCKCFEGYMIVGEASIGAQKCIRSDYAPTLSFDYERVEFPFIRKAGSNDEYQLTLNSIIFSHYYTQAASECEFANSYPMERSLNACQALANLCVMRYYDMRSVPCRQFQSIIADKRRSYYQGQVDWKVMMPWLYYTDEVDDIVEDRSIQMTMSLKDYQGKDRFMKFKLAKYAINGEFLGIEEVENQFIYCGTTRHSGSMGDGTGFIFGAGFTYEFQCDLKSLHSLEMHFFDLFLVDEKCDGKRDDSDCLYPVPIFNENIINEEGSLPNRNEFFGDDYDDIYTRRFFLFDNMSGRDNDGLKVIRYASRMILQTTIQFESPGKIYPPKLIIQYEEREIGETGNENYQADMIRISFGTEFTMLTDKFWSTVEVLSGFVSALTFVIWVFRVYNSNVKHRNPLTEIGEDTEFFLHAVMLGISTFIYAFFPFIFSLCLYWFSFIKLQDDVFLLLPPDNSYEYLFYNIFIHCLCWGQTIYIFYIIFKQCQIDVFFIDWEKPKGIRKDVSMWRTVMVANEFNKMQSSRKNSIGVNLALLIVLMDGGTSVEKNVVMSFAQNCLLWFLVAGFQRLVRFFLYERYYTESKGQRFLDLATCAKISVFMMDCKYHGHYLHCRSPYEYADCGMEKFSNEMGREASGSMISRGLDSPSIPVGCQAFEFFASETFQKQFRRHFSSSDSTRWRLTNLSSISNRILLMKTELHSFLVSFIEQSPQPQQESLRWIVREPMASDKILGLAPDNRSKDSPCVFYPDQVTWAQDYAFLTSTFLGIEFQLLLHDILVYNMVDIFISGSPYLSVAVTYIFHLIRKSVRQFFGSKNLSRKAFLDERFLISS